LLFARIFSENTLKKPMSPSIACTTYDIPQKNTTVKNSAFFSRRLWFRRCASRPCRR